MGSGAHQRRTVGQSPNSAEDASTRSPHMGSQSNPCLCLSPLSHRRPDISARSNPRRPTARHALPVLTVLV